MSWTNYIVVDELKMLFAINRRHSSDSIQEQLRVMKQVVDTVDDVSEDLAELQFKKVTEITVDDLDILWRCKNVVHGFPYDFDVGAIGLYESLRRYFQHEFEIVSDNGSEYDELKDSGYKVVS